MEGAVEAGERAAQAVIDELVQVRPRPRPAASTCRAASRSACRRFAVQSGVREPRGHRRQRDRGLQPGQRRTEAEVRAEPERQVPDRATVRDRSSSGSVVHRRIRCAAAKKQHHGVALGELWIAADRHVVGGDPADQLHRRVVAQRLLDDGRSAAADRRPAPPTAAGAAASPGSRWRSGSPSSRGRRSAAGCRSRRSPRAVSWSPSSSAAINAEIRSSRGADRRVVDEVAQVPAQPHARPPCARSKPSGRSPVKVMNGSSPCASSAEARLNCGSSSIGTPSSRQITATGSGWARSAIDIEACRRGSTSSSSAVDQSDDVGFERLDHPRRERLLRQLAQPGVIGRIEEQEPRRRRTAAAAAPAAIASLGHRGLQPVAAPRTDAAALRRSRAIERTRRGCRRRQPQRSALADLAVERIRVGAVGGVEQPHQQLLRFGEFGGTHELIVHARERHRSAAVVAAQHVLAQLVESPVGRSTSRIWSTSRMMNRSLWIVHSVAASISLALNRWWM